MRTNNNNHLSAYLVEGERSVIMKIASSILLLALLFFQCIEKEEVVPIGSQLLRNSDISSSLDNVSPWNATAVSPFVVIPTTREFKSGRQSLMISNTDSLTRNSGVWTQSYFGPIPNEGRSLRLRAFLKGENIRITGPGSNVFLSIRTFPVEDSNNSVFGRFVTTQNRFPIQGTFDWTPIDLVLPRIQKDVTHITVYLVMGPFTTGTVYFDDITLTVE